MIAAGTEFGPYRIVEHIGSGGMGEVYRATDIRLNREVAIKLVTDRYLMEAFGSGTPSSSSASPGSISHRRFLREAQASSALNHPNICTIYDIGEQDGRPYLVMELLRGETLKELLRRGPLSVTEVVAFSRQMTSALAAAHTQGIVHRDIKPANLFVVGGDGKRQIKVLDFGLAKQQNSGDASTSGDATATFAGMAWAEATAVDLGLTSPGSALGTVAYMSPEQAEGQPLDARTDLFSLGSVMYEMATGRPPFSGGSAAAIFAALLTKDPGPVSAARPGLPQGLDAIVAKLLRKDKTQRYQSAEEVERDLEALDLNASSGGISAAVPPVQKKAPRKGLTLGVIAALCVAIAAAAFPIWFHHKSSGPAPTGATAPVTPVANKDALILAEFSNKTGDSVFDTTLNQALVVQLEQSPVISLVSPQHLRKSVTYLGKPADTPVTPEIAREIGEREGVKAVLTGTIAPLGKAYVITLAAQKSATGDEIATTQATAPDKEHVLDAVNSAGAEMRGKLGEDLASIQKLNAPFGQATTPSLEAFRAFALGDTAKLRGQEIPEARDHYKRALELDPKLAIAWGRLGAIYWNAQDYIAGENALRKAHELSGNVSDREKSYIDELYETGVTGNFLKLENEALETLQTYPDSEYTLIHLGNAYMWTGQPEKAPLYYERAHALQPDDAVPFVDMLWAYGTLDNLDKVRSTLKEAQQRGGDGTQILTMEAVDWLQLGNLQEAERLKAKMSGRPDEFLFYLFVGMAYSANGQNRLTESTWRRAGDMAKQNGAMGVAADAPMWAAAAQWSVGRCDGVVDAAKHTKERDPSRYAQESADISLALCGEKSALPLSEETSRKYPQDTMQIYAFEPIARASLALKDGHPREAIDTLEKGRPYEQATAGPYLRGLAYLQLRDAQNAIAAFKDATKYRGASFWAYYYPIPYAQSWLGLGRAYVMAGDKANAKKAYARFFVEWKDADSDLPDLAAAKKEYAAL